MLFITKKSFRNDKFLILQLYWEMMPTAESEVVTQIKLG